MNVMQICAPKGTYSPDMLIKMWCIYAEYATNLYHEMCVYALRGLYLYVDANMTQLKN